MSTADSPGRGPGEQVCQRTASTAPDCLAASATGHNAAGRRRADGELPRGGLSVVLGLGSCLSGFVRPRGSTDTKKKSKKKTKATVRHQLSELPHLVPSRCHLELRRALR
jgi:hypothetical protein